MTGVAATDAFSRRPLSCAYRPFIGAILKGSNGPDLARSPSRRRMAAICALLPLPGPRRNKNPSLHDIPDRKGHTLFSQAVGPTDRAPNCAQGSMLRPRWASDRPAMAAARRVHRRDQPIEGEGRSVSARPPKAAPRPRGPPARACRPQSRETVSV
jgi:hypothetical protein